MNLGSDVGQSKGKDLVHGKHSVASAFTLASTTENNINDSTTDSSLALQGTALESLMEE